MNKLLVELRSWTGGKGQCFRLRSAVLPSLLWCITWASASPPSPEFLLEFWQNGKCSGVWATAPALWIWHKLKGAEGSLATAFCPGVSYSFTSWARVGICLTLMFLPPVCRNKCSDTQGINTNIQLANLGLGYCFYWLHPTRNHSWISKIKNVLLNLWRKEL